MNQEKILSNVIMLLIAVTLAGSMAGLLGTTILDEKTKTNLRYVTLSSLGLLVILIGIYFLTLYIHGRKYRVQ